MQVQQLNQKILRSIPQAEVQDTNDYYDCLYEEGTSGTRDNNSTYGDT